MYVHVHVIAYKNLPECKHQLGGPGVGVCSPVDTISGTVIVSLTVDTVVRVSVVVNGISVAEVVVTAATVVEATVVVVASAVVVVASAAVVETGFINNKKVILGKGICINYSYIVIFLLWSIYLPKLAQTVWSTPVASGTTQQNLPVGIITSELRRFRLTVPSSPLFL